jgi:hypothetical protein
MVKRRKAERVTRLPLPVSKEGRERSEPHPPANQQTRADLQSGKTPAWDAFVEEVCRQIDYIYKEAGRGLVWVVFQYEGLLRDYVTEDWAALMDLARVVQEVYEETYDEVNNIERRL